MRPRQKLLLFFFLVLIVILNIIGLRHKQLTYDEGNHYRYGQNILNLDSNRFDDSKMPFSALNALPHKIWTWIEPWKWTRFLHFLEKMRTGRYITVFFSVFTAWILFRWARELYGYPAGIVALLFYTFSPNILAHSRLITTDMYAAGMVLIALYFFWRFLNLGGWKKALASAVTLALAQLAKYTAVYLYPIFIVIVFFAKGPKLFQIIRNGNMRLLGNRLLAFLRYGFLFATVSIVVINAGFLFNRTGTKLKDYSFKSDLFKSLQSPHSPVAEIPLPLPYPFVEGLDLVRYYGQPGRADFKNYLFGELRKGEGFTGYYFYVLLFKKPLTLQLFFLTAVLLYLRRFRDYNFRMNESFLLTPIIFFVVYFNFFSRVDLGIRFFLVAFPLIYIFSVSLLKNWTAFSPRKKGVVYLSCVYLMASTLSYAPHFLSYFNELLWDRKQAYKLIADSNLDWGENAKYLERYQRKHPEVIVNPEGPTSGTIIVGANDLTGVNTDPERYRWLRENFEPVGHVAYSYLIFQVPPEQVPLQAATAVAEHVYSIRVKEEKDYSHRRP